MRLATVRCLLTQTQAFKGQSGKIEMGLGFSQIRRLQSSMGMEQQAEMDNKGTYWIIMDNNGTSKDE